MVLNFKFQVYSTKYSNVRIHPQSGAGGRAAKLTGKLKFPHAH